MGFELFAPKTPPVIGLDISPSAIRMVELGGDEGKMRLERIAIEPLPEGVMDEDSVHDPDALSKAIQNCHKKLGSRNKRVATCISSQLIATHHLQVPSNLSEQEMEEFVIDEMANKLSFSIEEASIDYQVLEEIDDETTEVFVAAAHKDRVEEISKAIMGAELEPVIIDSETLSMIDTVQRFMDRNGHDYEDRVIFVIDVGSKTTRFTFIKDGEVITERDTHLGSEQLNSDIADRLEVSKDDARKIQSGAIRAQNESDVIELRRSFSANISNEAKRAQQLFVTSSNYSQVDYVLLSGSGASLPGALDIIGEVFTNLIFFNPFIGMTIDGSVDKARLQRDSASLVIACGMAMRRFDK